ncbi:hypothetical protein FA13DRAFT_1718724 [Coprinellus micaceus]|uniref:Uncharacterized protein n=1 Tax=Coprinellus micaceus TaxID=71717 RepID=A0A4Y7SDH2_COPMI|nr:hypothetical protein FA13DRAFT_1718724 [Coprinellus micaceus]
MVPQSRQNRRRRAFGNPLPNDLPPLANWWKSAYSTRKRGLVSLLLEAYAHERGITANPFVQIGLRDHSSVRQPASIKDGLDGYGFPNTRISVPSCTILAIDQATRRSPASDDYLGGRERSYCGRAPFLPSPPPTPLNFVVMSTDKWAQYQWTWMTPEQKESIEGAALGFRLDGSHPKSARRFWKNFGSQWMSAYTAISELVESGQLRPGAHEPDYELSEEEAELVNQYKNRCCKAQLDGMYSLMEGPRLPLNRKPSKALRSWP